MATLARSWRYLLIAGLAIAVVAGCNRSEEAPRSPTAPSAAVSSVSLAPAANDVRGLDLAACLSASNASCFAAPRISAASVDAVPVTGPPLSLTASVSGSTVVLVWTAPSFQDAPVIGYVIDVGSSANFAVPDLASFDTANPATTLTVPLVPPGTYYVRLRARNALGLSGPSNEVQVIVGGVVAGPGCPGPPRSLSGGATGGLFTMTWAPPLSGTAQSYIIEAGSSSGAANLANFNTGTAATGFTRAGVPGGVYYVRVRAAAAGCSPSAPSNEIVVTVAGTTPAGSPLVTLTLAYTCSPCTGDPDNYALNVDCVSGRCTVFRTSNARSSGVITANVRMAPGVHNVEVVVRNPSSPWSLTFTASPPGAGGVVPSSYRVLFPTRGAGLTLAPCRVSSSVVESFFEFMVAGPSGATC